MYNGWIILYKPKGISSNQSINKIKRLLPKKQKIGFAGTLDPLAEGILPIALGEATKTIRFLSDSCKEYIFEATWGKQKDTDDLEGKTIKSSDTIPNIDDIENTIKAFIGPQQQIPPKFSAKKIAGKRACDLSRQGHQITLEPCLINIHKLNIIKNFQNRTLFKATCSKGTYIRSIARDIGIKLACYGYASSIIRSKVNNIDIKQAISLEKLADLHKKCILSSIIVPIQAVLDDIPAVLVNSEQANLLKSGQFLHNYVDLKNQCNENQNYLCIDAQNQPVAIAYIEENTLKPSRVFNL